ncbi:hypothetical protein PYCC9005_002133 [Savitreella phatthalungensis]
MNVDGKHDSKTAGVCDANADRVAPKGHAAEARVLKEAVLQAQAKDKRGQSKLNQTFTVASPLSSSSSVSSTGTISANARQAGSRSGVSSSSSGHRAYSSSYFPRSTTPGGSLVQGQSTTTVSTPRETGRLPQTTSSSITTSELETMYPAPRIYDLSLILSSDVGMSKFWTNIIEIFAKSYKADRVILTIPHDLTDVRNTPWGLKALWNANGLPQEIATRKQSGLSRAESGDYEDMEEFQVVTPGSDREAFWAMQENKDGIVYNSLQRLELEEAPLLENVTVHRVLERGGGLVVLNREYRNLQNGIELSDKTPGGTVMSRQGVVDNQLGQRTHGELPSRTDVFPPARHEQQKLRDPRKDVDDTGTDRPKDSIARDNTGPRRSLLRQLDYEEYEQPIMSPWSQSPAPSPAILAETDRSPFFHAGHTVDEGAFSPSSDDGRVSYNDRQCFEAIGMESALSVIHIPLVHPSTARAIAISGLQELKGQVPVGILSFESKVVPYPTHLIESLTALAPFIATAMSAAQSHASILHQLAYEPPLGLSPSARSGTGTTSPSMVSHSERLSPAARSIDATLNTTDSSMHVRSSYFPPTRTESTISTEEMGQTSVQDDDIKGPARRQPSIRLSRPALAHRRLASAPDLSQIDNIVPGTQSKRRRRTANKSLLHSLGANLQSSFHPASTTGSQQNEDANAVEAEVQAQPSSRLIRVIVDAIPVCVFTASPVTGRVTWVNERTLQYAGISAERFLKVSREAIHPEDRDRHIEGWETARTAGAGYNSQIRFRRFDGQYRWFLSRIVPLRDSRGVIVHWFGTMMDIHEQKGAEREAARRAETVASEAKYRGLAEASPQIVFSLTTAEGITYANQQWLSFSGQSFQQAKGLGFLSHVHPSDRDSCLVPSTRESGEGAIKRELRLLDKHGDYKWHLVKCVCIGRADDSPVENWLGTCTDINEHKLLEAKLQEAKEAATKNMESKTRFLSNMSHEIRTPLIGITGMVNFLLDTELSPEQLDYAHTIQQSAEALLAVINDILDLSKVEAGMMKLSIEPFSPRAMVEDATELLSTMAITKRLELNFVVEEDVPEVLQGDRIRLRQILLNIAGNAIKFTGQGEIFTRCFVSDWSCLSRHEIEIAWETVDTGPGFTTEEEKTMFKPFSQLDGSLTRRHGGTGLGLVISRQLAELHGGRLFCTSTKGVGSTFTFTARFKVDAETANWCLIRRQSEYDNKRQARSPVDETSAVTKEILVISESLYSIVALNHHIRQVLPPSWHTRIVTTDKFDAAVRSLKQPPSKTHCSYVVANLPRAEQILELVKLQQRLSQRGTTEPIWRLILVTSPLQRNLVKEQATDRQIDLETGHVSFAYKVIKPAKLAPFFTETIPVSSSLSGVPQDIKAPKDHVKTLAQQTVATQKAIFDDMSSKVGNRKLLALLVEDNPVNQKVMSKFCSKIGLEVDVVGDGQQCLDRLRGAVSDGSRPYDVILMDLHMPVLDGYQTCAEIRTWEQRREPGFASRRIPIIALSANVLSDVAERCKAAGFDQYLSKPVSFPKLAAKIGELMPDTDLGKIQQKP